MKFLKATVVGGLLFLLPLLLVLIVLEHGMRLAGKVAQPISTAFPVAADIGFGLVPALAVLVLVVVALGAGLVARTEAGKGIARWLESSFFSNIPQYQMMKSMAESLAHIEGAEGVRPALVNVEDGWQIGYLLESLEGGWVAAFLPQAPTPMSGNVMYLPADRVRPLGITMVQAMAIVKRTGIGSRELLRGVDLALPVTTTPNDP